MCQKTSDRSKRCGHCYDRRIRLARALAFRVWVAGALAVVALSCREQRTAGIDRGARAVVGSDLGGSGPRADVTGGCLSRRGAVARSEWFYAPGRRRPLPSCGAKVLYEPDPELAGCVVVVACRFPGAPGSTEGNGIIVHSGARSSLVMCPGEVVCPNGIRAGEVHIGIMTASWKLSVEDAYAEYPASIVLYREEPSFSTVILEIEARELRTVWEAQEFACFKVGSNMEVWIAPEGGPTAFEYLLHTWSFRPGSALFSRFCFIGMGLGRGDTREWPPCVSREFIANLLFEVGLEPPLDAMARCTPYLRQWRGGCIKW